MRKTLLTALAMSCAPGALALAQQPAASPKTDEPAPAVSAVVISGKRPDVVESIDRKSYSVANDLVGASGTISDVLRNLPSVDIDAQGNLSLRGDASVQVLIDGKPSTTMSAANRAETLQSLPADTVDRIEVITNPSAAFKPDGGAGVINIITKKSRKPGLSGSVRASAGSDGRASVGGSISRRKGPLQVSANASMRRDLAWRPFTDDRTRIDPATGSTTRSRQDTLLKSRRTTAMASASVDYDLTAKDRLGVGGSYSSRTGDPRVQQRNLTQNASGAVTGDYDRIGTGREREDNTEATARYRHVFDQAGREFTLDLRRGQTIEKRTRLFTNRYRLPAGPVTMDEQRPRGVETQGEATAEYKQDLAGGKLLIGYDYQRNSADYQAFGATTDPLTGVTTPDPAMTNRFLYVQRTHALYGTYDRKLSTKLTAVLGLRLEDTSTDGDQVDTAQRDHTGYFRVYPTLHLQYDLTDSQNLRLSYSKRIYRPDIEDLNPYPVFSDPLNVRAGNPHLKPKETQSFEAGYAYESGATSWGATAYYRLTDNAFAEVSRFISPTVLLTTHENVGKNTAAGLDVSGRGKLTPKLSYRLSGNVGYNRFDGANLGLGARQGVNGSAKAGLDFQATASDMAQISIDYRSKRPLIQGDRLAVASVNLGYRHVFKSGSSAVLAVSDLFDSARERTRIDTATLVESSWRRNSRRAISLTLSMPFGGRKAETSNDLIETGG